MKKIIAVLAGDGIGPEVMMQTRRVLNHIEKIFNHRFEYLEGAIGGEAYEKYQSHCPEETVKLCQKADAILFGSVGGPVKEQHQKKWQQCEINSILKLRKQFNLAINIRPICVYQGVPTNQTKKPVDFIIFRELTGGIYFGHREISHNQQQRIAIDECVYTEEQIQRIAHAAFKTAKERRKKLCSVDKANVLATSRLWRDIFSEIAAYYPEVTLTHLLIDNCVMQLMTNPQQFDVIVTENMFGDILSDLAAVLPGSLGLIPSASLRQDGFGLYEPAGGSAPDIAGQGIANPCAQILSAAMMLRYSFGLQEEPRLIEAAITQTLEKKILTADLASKEVGPVSMSAFTDSVLSHIF